MTGDADQAVERSSIPMPRGGTRSTLTGARSLLDGRDLAFGYSAVVIAITVALAVSPVGVAERFVLESSTNLANLRDHPPFVLIASAFIEPSLSDLWIVPLVVLVYGALQRWLGRAAVVVTAVLGHVGATLVVATMLTAGIVHDRVSLSVAQTTDVGVSYGLAAAAGLLAAQVSPRWARAYRLGLSALFVGMLLIERGFTDLGHLAAWLIGLALALLVRRAGATSAAT